MQNPTVQQSTIDLIRGFEKFVGTPYLDSNNYWTIGYGARFINNQPVTHATPAITIDEAETLLNTQIKSYATEVSDSVKTLINQHEYDACVSLCYNVGVGGFAASTVLREINAQDFPAAADAFLLWDKNSQGQVVEGLLNRREAERAVFLQTN